MDLTGLLIAGEKLLPSTSILSSFIQESFSLNCSNIRIIKITFYMKKNCFFSGPFVEQRSRRKTFLRHSTPPSNMHLKMRNFCESFYLVVFGGAVMSMNHTPQTASSFYSRRAIIHKARLNYSAKT